MQNKLRLLGFVVMAGLLAGWPNAARAQGGFQPVSADALTRAVPGDFYLEGNRIPVEKRNAAVLKNSAGKHLLLALIDTSGYSSQIQQKYTGMLITETRIEVCGTSLGVGSYGFGLARPAEASHADAPFKVYNQAGDRVAQCSAKKDDSLKPVRPLAVVPGGAGASKLCLGKYAVEFK